MDVASGGPVGPGNVTTDQVVTFRRNTDNPAGNTFAAMSNPLTATFRLSNQRYPGAGTQTTFGDGGGYVPYDVMALLAGPDNQFTSTGVGAATGVGINQFANGSIYIAQYANGPLAQAAPVNGRIPMADLTITFSRPVDNPVFHIVGLGGNQGPKSFTNELSLVSPGTLTRLSGSPNLVVAGNQINNNAVAPAGGLCASGITGCGSVRLNGTGLTSVTFTLFLRGDALDPWEAGGEDLMAIGVSVDQPPKLTVHAQSYGTTGNFNYTGTNGFPAQNLQTVTPGTPVAAPTQVLAVGSQTVVTQSIVSGPALAGIACANSATGAPVPGAVVNLAAGTVTLDNDAVESGAEVDCTFTYGVPPPPPRLTVTAQSFGATGNFNYTGTNGFPTQNVQTVTPGTPVAAPPQVLAIGSQTVVTQSIVSGPPLTGIACTNSVTGAAVPGAVVNLAAGTVTLDNDAVAVGAQVGCTFTYGTPPPPPQLIVRAQSYGATGNFYYTGTNGFQAQNVQTVTPGTAVAAPTQVLAVGSQTVVTQNIVSGPPLTGIACANSTTGAAVPGAVVNLAAGTVTLDNDAVAPGAQVQCTFTYGTSPSVANIPTLGQWGLMLLSLLLAAFSAPMLRRR